MKKTGISGFCIDLQKLDAHVIKDSYSLSRIEDSLDCLNSAMWFTALDLKSGYWQVEMDEASKQCGFYKCDCIPLGLTNLLDTFQRLKKTLIHGCFSFCFACIYI